MAEVVHHQLLGVGAATLRQLRANVIATENGADTLRRAGYAGGAAAYAAFERWVHEEQGRNASYAPAEDFHGMVSTFFEQAGWGRITFDSLQDAASVVDIEECWEVDGAQAAPGCHLTTGML